MTSFLTRNARAASADVAIDFGTANILVGEIGSGIVLDEPSVCCFIDDGGRSRLYAAGAGAHPIVERATGRHRIAKPLRSGVMSDIDAGRELLRYAIDRTGGRRAFRRAKVLIGVPADATPAERMALLTAARDAGISNTRLFDEPLMAAIGAGLAIEEPRGRMLIDCGAGTTEVVVISLGGIYLTKSVRIGGDTLDEAIINHLHLRHRFEIGITTAERVKREIAADGSATRGVVEMRGKQSATRMPGILMVPVDELLAVVARHVGAIAETVKSALSETPPELSRDILDDGITLTGGSSVTNLLSQSITAATGLAVQIADRPRDCVALGLASILERRR